MADERTLTEMFAQLAGVGDDYTCGRRSPPWGHHHVHLPFHFRAIIAFLGWFLLCALLLLLGCEQRHRMEFGWSCTPSWSWFVGGVLPQGYLGVFHGITGVLIDFRGSIWLVLGRRRLFKDSFGGALADAEGTASSFPTGPGDPHAH
jgi:hypothetical protein